MGRAGGLARSAVRPEVTPRSPRSSPLPKRLRGPPEARDAPVPRPSATIPGALAYRGHATTGGARCNRQRLGAQHHALLSASRTAAQVEAREAVHEGDHGVVVRGELGGVARDRRHGCGCNRRQEPLPARARGGPSRGRRRAVRSGGCARSPEAGRGRAAAGGRPSGAQTSAFRGGCERSPASSSTCSSRRVRQADAGACSGRGRRTRRRRRQRAVCSR